MTSYISDIGFALLVFPLVALLSVVPYAIAQYRRFGAVNLWKTFVVFSFIFYAMCVVFLVLMPLPADRSIVVPGALTPQLVPFHTIQEMLAIPGFEPSDPSTWIVALRSTIVYATLFNILMTMPLGFYFRYLFRLPWWLALCLGFLTSLLFEVTQFTGIYGIYEHPYRYADVDDLITNTLGTMLGFWLTLPLVRLLPDLGELNAESIARGRARVSATRRFLAFAIDASIVVVVAFAAQWLLGVFGQEQLLGAEQLIGDLESGMLEGGEGQDGAALPEAALTIHSAWAWLKTLVPLMLRDPLELLILVTVIVGIVFMGIPMIDGGRTPGQALVGIKIVTEDGTRPPWYRYVVRYGVFWAIVFVPLLALVLFPGNSFGGISFATSAKVLLIVYCVWIASLGLRALLARFGYRFILLSDVISQTSLAPAR